MTDAAQTATDTSTAITAAAAANSVEDVRTGLQADALQQAITDHLRYSIGRPGAVLKPEHYYLSGARASRARPHAAALDCLPPRRPTLISGAKWPATCRQSS